ncbi:MAG: phosphotransferase, partial [Bdellovibrionales bacterium]|nr:phosphotransferase [Bdellovibrionales bacterium]
MRLDTFFSGAKPGAPPAPLQPLQVGSVRDRFDISRPLYQVRNAHAFEAYDRVENCNVALWMLRFPVQPVSQEAAQIIGHLMQLQRSAVQMPRMIAYGVDRNGTAFYAAERVKGATLARSGVTPRMLPRLLHQMADRIAAVHNAGLALGTLCDESFLVTSGELLLIALFPSLPMLESYVALKPSESAMTCQAPEQRDGQPASKAADVYALGALLYRLVGSRCPPTSLSDRQLFEHVRTYSTTAFQGEHVGNAWLGPILEQSLRHRAGDRFPDAQEMVRTIEDRSPKIDFRTAAKIRALDAQATAYLLSPAVRCLIVAFICIVTLFLVHRRAAERGLLNAPQAELASLGSGPIGESTVTDVRNVSALAPQDNLSATLSRAGAATGATAGSGLKWSGTVHFGRQEALAGDSAVPVSEHLHEPSLEPAMTGDMPASAVRVPGVRTKP